MSQKTIKFLSIDLIDIKGELNNLSEIYNFMDKLLLQTNLKQIHKPVLIPYYYGKLKRDVGVSSYAFFDGGYCTFHIFEKRRIAYFDIISDIQDFNTKSITKNLTKFCGTKNIIINDNIKLSEKISKKIFGPHYLLYGKPKKTFDTDSLISLQESIINEIGMTPIISPTVIKSDFRTLVFIAIAESHIALTLCNNRLRIDIFSCKMFDLDILKNLVNKFIKVENETLYNRLYKV